MIPAPGVGAPPHLRARLLLSRALTFSGRFASAGFLFFGFPSGPRSWALSKLKVSLLRFLCVGGFALVAGFGCTT